MQLIANLISKIGVFVFFLLMEGLALFFIVSRSDFHRSYLGENFMAVNGFFSDKISYITHYGNLPEENEKLTAENALLKSKLQVFTQQHKNTATDSIFRQKYAYQTAQIVDYSLNKRDNYFLINKGKKEGIKEDMAVLSPYGVVGAVLNVSNHYADVIPVIHSRTNIKAKVKGLNYLGIIQWDGKDHRVLSLKEIPKYLAIKKGDTVLTAGASAIYPEGELIGKVSHIAPNDKTGDYDIEVTTFEDLANVRNVYVVENLEKPDIDDAKEKENNVSE